MNKDINAIGIVRQMVADGQVSQEVAEKYFPELKESKESEGEKIRKALIRFHKSTIDVDGIKGEDIIAWLEKQSEQKPAWSEENEKEVAVLEAYIRSKDWSERHIDRALGIVDELVNKVKSLRPQNTWKPSELQIEALAIAIRCGIKLGTWEEEALKDLIEQLKKLREE